jgi:hypothetical protein
MSSRILTERRRLRARLALRLGHSAWIRVRVQGSLVLLDWAGAAGREALANCLGLGYGAQRKVVSRGRSVSGSAGRGKGEEGMGVSFASTWTDARRGEVPGREDLASIDTSPSLFPYASDQAERDEVGRAGTGVDSWTVLMGGEGEWGRKQKFDEPGSRRLYLQRGLASCHILREKR